MDQKTYPNSPLTLGNILVNERTMSEACALSSRALMRLRARRLIPFVKLGGAIRYSPAAVQQALEKLTVRARHDGRAS
jgi:hypothetical protein